MQRNVINSLAKVYERLPYPLKRPASNLWVLPRYLRWRSSPDGLARTKRMLDPLRGRFAGHRCVVIGNGPSLRKTNLALLRDEYTFGLNRIYLLFEELGFETTFLVVANRFVLDQFADDFNALTMPKFFTWDYRAPFIDDPNTAFVMRRPDQKITGDLYTGHYNLIGTVTNLALELAYFMGFSEVVLIGVDHSWREQGTGREAVVSQSTDQNHFHPNYFGKGIVWQLPDYVEMELGYAALKRLFEADGRRVVDATVGGHLQIFPKAAFEAHLAASTFRNRAQSDLLG